ncbi:MAG: hypothetical protein GY858_05275 [Candidatus Omnitrophica bacterium]|nr:hypothetical protein [Candidatus Omnitrophota bacterium]
MLCDICHKSSATVHFTEIVNGKVQELHVCPACAKGKTTEFKEQLNIPDLLGGFLGSSSPSRRSMLKCPMCGLTYGQFKKEGRLGCGNCYIVFREQMVHLLKNIHGSIEYMGKFPQKRKKKVTGENKLQQLKKKLERAVKLEEYEDAARLRDQIKNIESRIKD